MKAVFRRIALLLLCLLLGLLPSLSMAEGLRGYDKAAGYQYVLLGSWPQGENGEVQPILWRVLSADTNEALLLSEYVLGNRRVHPDDKEYVAFGGVWNLTDMFDFLNSTFLNEGFTKPEQSLLLTSEELGTLFYLGEELSTKAFGFTNDKSRMGKGTPYALLNGLFKYSTKFSPYWTRSQSTTKTFGARCTKVKGNLGYIRVVVENLGWRPALRLNLAAATFAGGDGSLASPYTLTGKTTP